jgi:hypothetical protein
VKRGVLTCRDLPGWNQGKCCISCHDDWDELGIEMVEIYGSAFDDLRWHICCSAQRFLDYAWEGSDARVEVAA